MIQTKSFTPDFPYFRKEDILYTVNYNGVKDDYLNPRWVLDTLQIEYDDEYYDGESITVEFIRSIPVNQYKPLFLESGFSVGALSNMYNLCLYTIDDKFVNGGTTSQIGDLDMQGYGVIGIGNTGNIARISDYNQYVDRINHIKNVLGIL